MAKIKEVDVNKLTVAQLQELLKQKKDEQAQRESEIGEKIKTKVQKLMEDFEYTDYTEFVKTINRVFKPKTEGNTNGVGRGHRLPDDKREAIKTALQKSVDAKNGKGNAADFKSGSVIAKEFGVSLPTVQSIKKEMGLVAA